MERRRKSLLLCVIAGSCLLSCGPAAPGRAHPVAGPGPADALTNSNARAAPSAVADEPLAAQFVRTAGTDELAPRLLPPELAEGVVTHEVREFGLIQGPPSGVRLFKAPVPYGPRLCRRDSYHVGLRGVESDAGRGTPRERPVRVEEVTETVQLALAPGCRLEQGTSFGWVQPARVVDEAGAALLRLAEARARARRRPRSVRRVTCRSELPEDACAPGAASVLASLPVETVYLINREVGGWELALMPDGPGPGSRHWSVRLSDNSPDIEMVWRSAPPF